MGRGPRKARFSTSLETRTVADELLDPTAAALRLGITRTTLYDWLGLSRRNLLEIHGRRATIEFFQTGAKAQGRIRIESREVERIKELMRIVPTAAPVRRLLVARTTYPHINVPLGRPDR
jgi:hypothetical protein